MAGSDFDLLFRTRLTFWENESPDPRIQAQRFHPHTLTSVTDGASNTLFFAENLRTGRNQTDPRSNWAATHDRLTSVFAGAAICREYSCVLGNVDFSLANFGDAAINAGRSADEGLSPYPSSWHPGGVNVALLDGSVRFLNESVDGRIYLGLFTPQGSQLSGVAIDTGITPTPF